MRKISIALVTGLFSCCALAHAEEVKSPAVVNSGETEGKVAADQTVKKKTNPLLSQQTEQAQPKKETAGGCGCEKDKKPK